MGKEKSLTDAQVERQDAVDNACHSLLNELAPNDVIEWNQEYISAVREAVQEVIVEKLHLMTEMDFYPYLEEVK